MMYQKTAESYGLFQVVFADLTDHLACATFLLGKRKTPELTFEGVFRKGFRKILAQFRSELRQFEGKPSLHASLHALEKLCSEVEELAKWRNDRIHARVHLTKEGCMLYDWRTNAVLELRDEEIKKSIDLALRATVSLQSHTRELEGSLKLREELDGLFARMRNRKASTGLGRSEG